MFAAFAVRRVFPGVIFPCSQFAAVQFALLTSKTKNGPNKGKFWSPEPGNAASESSRRRRKDGGLHCSPNPQNSLVFHVFHLSKKYFSKFQKSSHYKFEIYFTINSQFAPKTQIITPRTFLKLGGVYNVLIT